MRYWMVCLLISILHPVHLQAQKNPDAIIGKWMSDEDNLEVEVYKVGNEFKAKVLWFDDSDDKSKPMSTRTDEKNPDKALRNRRIIGLEVLSGLTYDEDDDEWVHGAIYDSKSGKDWSAKVWLNKDNRLKVRGYWLVSLFGETMTFKKV